MSIRSAIAGVFGRKKASPWADLRKVADTPMTPDRRSDIRATADDAARLLASHDNAQRRAPVPEKPRMDEPYMPKWYE